MFVYNDISWCYEIIVLFSGMGISDMCMPVFAIWIATVSGLLKEQWSVDRLRYKLLIVYYVNNNWLVSHEYNVTSLGTANQAQVTNRTAEASTWLLELVGTVH